MSTQDFVLTHAALAMQAAERKSHKDVEAMKVRLANDLEPATVTVETMQRTGATPEEISKFHQQRYDASWGQRVDAWRNVEYVFKGAYNQGCNSSLPANFNSLGHRDGKINYRTRFDLFKGIARPIEVQWVPSMVGPRNGYLIAMSDVPHPRHLILNSFIDASLSAPADGQQLKQLIATKVQGNKDRTLCVSGLLQAVFVPRLVEFRPGSFGGGSLVPNAGYGRLEFTATRATLLDTSIK